VLCFITEHYAQATVPVPGSPSSFLIARGSPISTARWSPSIINFNPLTLAALAFNDLMVETAVKLGSQS
jgi:hypothetical protein